jgi:hypothetical protein
MSILKLYHIELLLFQGQNTGKYLVKLHYVKRRFLLLIFLSSVDSEEIRISKGQTGVIRHLPYSILDVCELILPVRTIQHQQRKRF